MDWEKIFSNGTTDRGSFSKIYTQRIWFNRKNNQPNQKRAEDLNRQFSIENTNPAQHERNRRAQTFGYALV